jgi:hypothetical protein
MTDLITTSPITIGRADPQRRKRPKLGIGATFAALFKAVAQASTMAYVAPYGTTRRQPSSAASADTDGRDPSW